MHTVLDFETLLPEFVCITNGKGADNTIAKKLHFARGAIVVADRIYSDTELLNHWDSTGVIFDRQREMTTSNLNQSRNEILP